MSFKNIKCSSSLESPNSEMFVCAGKRPGHAGPDGVAPRGAGRPPTDLQAVVRIRGGRHAGVPAGLHRRSDGKRSRAANSQWYVALCVGGRRRGVAG